MVTLTSCIISLRTTHIMRGNLQPHHEIFVLKTAKYLFLYMHFTAKDLLYAPSHRHDDSYHSLCYIVVGPLVGMGKSPIIGPLRRTNPVTKSPQVCALLTKLNLTPG